MKGGGTMGRINDIIMSIDGDRGIMSINLTKFLEV